MTPKNYRLGVWQVVRRGAGRGGRPAQPFILSGWKVMRMQMVLLCQFFLCKSTREGGQVGVLSRGEVPEFCRWRRTAQASEHWQRLRTVGRETDSYRCHSVTMVAKASLRAK